MNRNISSLWKIKRKKGNEYDKEAIKVTYEGLGKIGYVANSSYTVLGDSMSAGRIYDKIGKKAKAQSLLQSLLSDTARHWLHVDNVS